MNPSLFSSQDYVQYRFEYPESIFLGLRSFLGKLDHSLKPKVLDLGCGTGLVTASFLEAMGNRFEMHLSDVDPQMLQEAQKALQEIPSVVSFQCANSSQLPYPEESFDLILIGSAWHWMDASSTIDQIKRILKPGGVVFIFEYQFPKSLNLAALNDWIRIQFNTVWKPQTQVPRGTLKELTRCWLLDSAFSQIHQMDLQWIRDHDASSLAGVIASQSRYQHFEQSLSKEDQLTQRNHLTQNLDLHLDQKSSAFSYFYEGYAFKKRL